MWLYWLIIAGGLWISLFVHRAWSHRSWKPKRWLNIVGLAVHTSFFFTNSIQWCLTHRKHHHLEDTVDDPHSPYFMNRFLIVVSPKVVKGVSLEYVKDILKDSDHIFFRKHFYTWNLILWALLYIIDPSFYLLGLWWAVMGGISFKMRFINSIGHADPVNKSTTNRPFWAWIYLDGEPWHRNHSTDPGNWRIGRKWYEVDFGNYCIWAFEKLGWATITQQKFKRSF